MSATGSIRVASLDSYFQLVRDETGEWLRPVSTGERDVMGHPWPRGAQVLVRVDVFEADGRLFVGKVEVDTTPQPLDLRGLGLGILDAPAVEPLPVGTELWRMIPLGAVSRAALQSVYSKDGFWQARMELADDPEAFDRLAAATNTRARQGERRRPGRPSSMTPELLNLVGKAVRASGPRGARAAVQGALQDAGFAGSGTNGEVTADQAKKAIERWRKTSKDREAHVDSND